MATTSELIASGEMLLDDKGHYIILQQHFSDGTLIIDTEGGYFKLAESIEFKPNPVGKLVTKTDAGLVPPDDPTAGDVIALDASLAGRPLLSQYDLDGPGPDQGYDPAAFGIGFFAAIAITSGDVTVDLNDYTLEQSEEHALLQRFYANIELASTPFLPGQGPHDFGSTFAPANNVTILNGTLGLSSHHGIHGNSNENVTIEDVVFKDFEVAAIALNGAKGAYIEDVTATNRKDVPVLGTFSNSLFLVPYINYLASWDRLDGVTDLVLEFKDPITEEVVRSLSIYDVQAALVEAIDNVYEDVIEKGGSINKGEHEDEYNLFHNSFGVVDGNAYGIVTGAEGVQVNGYPFVDVSNPSTDLKIKDVKIENLHSAVSEIPALNYEGTAVTDPIGAVVMLLNDPNGVPNTLSENSLDGYYQGNVLSNAQLMVAMGIEEGAFDGSHFDVSRNGVNNELIAWAESGHPLSDLVGTYGLDDGLGSFDWFYNGDTMFHVNKGTIGFKLDGSEDLELENLSVKGLRAYGLPGSSEGGDYDKGHPQQTLSGYNGAASIAYSFAGTEDVTAKRLRAKNIYSDWGEVFGLRIFNGSRDITIDNSTIKSLHAGVLGQPEAPNPLAAAYPVYIGEDTSEIIVHIGNVFTVDNTDDHGPGSLRQAIEEANATPGTDTIRFNPKLRGQKIILTGGELQISDSVRIDGLLRADDLTISGNNTSGIFSIDDFDAENQVKVVIDKLTLTEGNSDRGGGAIANSEKLIISQSKIVNNQNTSIMPTDGGGAIRNSDTGKLIIDQTLIANNQSNAFGGGVTNFGELDVYHSTISHNQVTGGGGAGIDNRGVQTEIRDSLIAYNTNTVGPAGGFGNGTSGSTTVVDSTIIVGNQAALNGGGFFVNAGKVQITNSFVKNNQAQSSGGGAGVAADGNLEINNSLFFSNSAEVNGGGIDILEGSIDLKRSLVFGNAALTGDGGGIFNEGGFVDLDSSLVFANTPNNIMDIAE